MPKHTFETKSYSLQIPPIQAQAVSQHDNTLHKNDSLHSKGLYQVTEKNSENQSVLNPPSQLQKHVNT